jgi:hypothetical protein
MTIYPLTRIRHCNERVATMNKRDALRLKPGDIIMFGNSMWSEKVYSGAGPRWGQVLQVTPKGGIRVELLKDYSNAPTGVLLWVPYHHVIDVHEAPSRAPMAYRG